eukprot:5937868-Prymnesium_polylepis.2
MYRGSKESGGTCEVSSDRHVPNHHRGNSSGDGGEAGGGDACSGQLYGSSGSAKNARPYRTAELSLPLDDAFPTCKLGDRVRALPLHP